MKESDQVLVGLNPERITVLARGPYPRRVGFLSPDGSAICELTIPESDQAEWMPPGPARQNSLADDYARSQRRGRWVLRLLVTAVLIGAVIYARWLWGRL